MSEAPKSPNEKPVHFLGEVHFKIASPKRDQSDESKEVNTNV